MKLYNLDDQSFETELRIEFYHKFDGERESKVVPIIN